MIYKPTIFESKRYAFDLYQTVNFDGNGGTVEYSRKKYAVGSAYYYLPSAERDGWYFDGWVDADGVKVPSARTVSKSQTLYASWSQTKPDDYMTFSSTGDSTVKIVKVGSPTALSLQYRIDDGSWQTYTVGNTITLADGQTMKMKGNNATFSCGDNDRYYFQMTGKIIMSGSIMTLMDETNTRSEVLQRAFLKMFLSCTALTKLENFSMPATTLGVACYADMFDGCTSLVDASTMTLADAELPDYCARLMFYGCSNLKRGPDIPNWVFNGNKAFDSFFKGCSKLNYIKVGFTDWNPSSKEYVTQTWVNGVAANGTFVCPAALAQTRGADYIPENWVIQTY